MIKISKLVATNFKVFIGLLISCELILGKWHFINQPVTRVPAARFSNKLKRDISKINGLKKPFYITSTRDNKGYRSTKNYLKSNIILTIGGSNVAQTLVDDQLTWQAMLNRKLDKKYAVVNGGVSGQTSIGHLYALEDWHSKALPLEQVKVVIYYFGILDTFLLDEIKSRKEIEAQAYANSRFWKIKSFLSRYSFFYSKIKEIRDKYIPSIDKENKFFGYNLESDVTEKIREFKLSKIDLVKRSHYINLIQDLHKKTKSIFPYAKIFWVQQDIPGCKFINSNHIIDRFKENQSKELCKKLGEVYYLQDIALNKIISEDNHIIKMHLDNPLTDQSTIDSNHTNEMGNIQISNYLFENIFNKIYFQQ